MGFDWVDVLSLETIEPITIRDKYSRGAHYFSPPYIPSSTISGAIASFFFRRRNLNGKIEDLNMWMSHAFPSDRPFELCEPPPLPLATLSREKNGNYLSLALIFARAMKGELQLIDKTKDLSKKVGTVFINNEGSFKPPKKEIITQVTLGYDRRTHYVVEDRGEKYGLLFTQEIIRPGSKFHAIAFLDSSLHEELKEGVRIKIGAFTNKGFGLTEVKVEKSMSFDDYRTGRMRKLESKHEFVTVDVVTFSSRNKLLEIGNPIYEKVRISDFKAWLNGKFYIYRKMIGPGSVLVYPRDNFDPERIVQIELTPPSDALKRFHGIDMIFFDNPFHFDSMSKFGR
jgi:hypothetical protein